MNKRIIGLVIAITIAAPPVLAQELEEITVTAQRREQSLQDVPVSVSAFGAEAIENQNIKSATDYLAITPNVSYTEDGQFGKRSAGISVRGINNLVSGENASVPSIGVYLDEFSVASVPNQFANPQLPDMERIEVLRGPQGTFFGRNAVGGALNLTTRNPTEEREGNVSAGFETYDNAGDLFRIGGMFNLPVSDAFKLRGVVSYEDSSGYVSNICAAGATSTCPVAAQNGFTPNGAPDSGHEYLAVRLKGLWDISDDTSILATLMFGNEEQGHDENVPSGITDLDTVDIFGIPAAIDPGTGFWPNNRNLLSHDVDERNDTESMIAIINVTHSYNENLTLKWITGVIDAEFDRFFDNDLIGGLEGLRRTNLYEGTSFSSELRLEGSNDRMDWVVGVMISKDDQEQFNDVHLGVQPTGTINGAGPFLPPFPEGLSLALNNKSFELEGLALFGDITYHATDRVDLIFGGRFSNDEATNTFGGFGIGPAPGGGLTNLPRPVASGSDDFTDFAPRFGVRYQMSDEVGIYAMASKGYKAGGFSLGNDTNNMDAPLAIPYAEEILWNYELGLKSELLDRRLRLNAALFHSRWEDMQFEAFRLLTPGDLTSNFELTVNIEEATVTGFEVEFEALLTEYFSVSGGIGVLDSEFDDNQLLEITGGFQVSVNGLELPKAPELSWNLAGEYRWPVDSSEAWVRLELVHRDGQYSDIEGLTNRQTRGPSPNAGLVRPVGPGEFPFLSPNFDVVNLRGGWQSDRWGVQVFVQNLTDEEYYTGTQENFGLSGIRLRPHPRIIGGNVTFNF